MSLGNDLISSGLSAAQSRAVLGAVATGLTATGATQATAKVLSSVINMFSTVAAATGAILPVGSNQGDSVIISNDGANDLNVYPPLAGTVANGGANVPYVLPAGATAVFWCTAYKVWTTMAGFKGTGGALTGGGAATQVALWSGASNLTGTNNFTFDDTLGVLAVVGKSGSITVDSASAGTFQIVDAQGTRLMFNFDSVNGNISGDKIAPGLDDTWDLGVSAIGRWKNAFISQTIELGATPFVFSETAGVLQLGDAGVKWTAATKALTISDGTVDPKLTLDFTGVGAYTFENISGVRVQLGDTALNYGDAGGNLFGNDNALQVGPARSLWMRAPDHLGSPAGVEIFADMRGTVGGGFGMFLGVQGLLGTGLNLYQSYSDDQNFTALSLIVGPTPTIAVYNLSGGNLVDTLLLITGEGGQGVILTDELDLKGWGTGTTSGDHSWAPSDNAGGALDNQLDLGGASNHVRTGYFGTSVVNSGYDEFASSTTPGAPTAAGRLYSKTVGGKVKLYALFPSGAEQLVASEP